MWILTIENLETGVKTQMPSTSRHMAFATISALAESKNAARHKCYLKYIGGK